MIVECRIHFFFYEPLRRGGLVWLASLASLAWLKPGKSAGHQLAIISQLVDYSQLVGLLDNGTYRFVSI